MVGILFKNLFASAFRGGLCCLTATYPGYWTPSSDRNTSRSSRDRLRLPTVLTEKGISILVQIVVKRSRLRMQVLKNVVAVPKRSRLSGGPRPAPPARLGWDLVAIAWSWPHTLHQLSLLRISGAIVITHIYIYGVDGGSCTSCSKKAVGNSRGVVFSIENVCRDEHVSEGNVVWIETGENTVEQGGRNSRTDGRNPELYRCHSVIVFFYYLFITCNWVDTRWQGSLHVTLARTMKILL